MRPLVPLVVLLAACSSPEVTITVEPTGSNCRAGGVKIQSGGVSAYACNGADGMNAEVDTPAQVLGKLKTVDGMGSELDSDTLDGLDSTAFVYTAGAGVSIAARVIAADTSVVQARVTGTCAAGQAVANVGGDGGVGCVAVSPFRSTVIVSGIGTPVENGATLRAAITGATGTAARHTLVHIEPGHYDLGASGLLIPAFVDVEGSGEDATRLTGAASGGVLGVRHDEAVEIRSLTVENAFVGTFSQALTPGQSTGASTGLRKLSHLTLKASAGTMFNHALSGAPNPMLVVDCTLIATGVGATGLFTNSNQHVEVYGSRITATAPVISQSGQLLVAGSMLDGTGSSGATCVGSFNAAFAPLTSTCGP